MVLSILFGTSIIETSHYFTLFRHRNHTISIKCIFLNTERITWNEFNETMKLNMVDFRHDWHIFYDAEYLYF